MIQKGQKIPFDVIPHRAISFSHTHPDDHGEARELLLAAVTEAIAPGFEPDNPIMHARGRLEFEQKATPAMKVLSDEIASLRVRFDTLESWLFRPVAGLGPASYRSRRNSTAALTRSHGRDVRSVRTQRSNIASSFEALRFKRLANPLTPMR